MRRLSWVERVGALGDVVAGRSMPQAARRYGVDEQILRRALGRIYAAARRESHRFTRELPEEMPAQFTQSLARTLREALSQIGVRRINSGALARGVVTGLILGLVGIFGEFTGNLYWAILASVVLLGALIFVDWRSQRRMFELLSDDADVRVAVVKDKLREKTHVCGQLERAVSDLARERNEVGSEIVRMQSVVETTRIDCERSESARLALQIQLAKIEAENNVLRQEVDRQRQDLNASHEKSRGFERELAEVKTLLDGARRQAEKCKAERDVGQCEISRLNDYVRNLSRTIEFDARRLVHSSLFQNPDKEWMQAVSVKHDDVVVLFADVSGFTRWSETLEPPEVASQMARLIADIDSAASRYGLGRVKTIGDEIMLVSKLFSPESVDTKVADAVSFAMTLKSQANLRLAGMPWKIGMAVGPLASAMLTKEVASIDVWGRTVNLAARLLKKHGKPENIVLCKKCGELLLSSRHPRQLVAFNPELEGLPHVEGAYEIAINQ